MMRLNQRILSFFTALLLIPCFAFAKNVTLGAVTDIHPFTYYQGDQLAGIDVEIGREIFERLGIELEIKTYPWKRLARYLKDGKLDGPLVLFDYMFKERFRGLFDMVPECLYVSKLAIYARKDRELSVSSPADLKGKSIGTIDEDALGPEFDAYRGGPEGFKRVQALDDENLVIRLARGRIDLAVVEDISFWFYSKQHGLQDQFEELYIVKKSPLCIGFSRQTLGSRSKVLADQVSNIVKQLKTEGIIQKILDKYK